MATIVFGGGAKAFSGNSVLNGCRIVNPGASDDVALDWNLHTHGASAVFHVHGTEGVGNAADSVNGFDITPGAWAGAGNGWLGNDAMQNSWQAVSAIPQICPATPAFTIEFWWWRDVNTNGDETDYFDLAGEPQYIKFLEYTSARYRCQMREFSSPNSLWDSVNLSLPAAGTWIHLCIERLDNVAYHYCNGVIVNSPSCANLDTLTTNTIWRGTNSANQTARWCDFYGATAAEHGGVAFSPYRYFAGSVGLKDGLAGARTLSSVAWTATTGAGYGAISGVYYQSASGVWTQIGGANPTSPLTGTWAIPAGLTESVRFSLSPKADALQSETPVLLTATLDFGAAFVGTGRVVTPYRLGPRLLPIGGLL